MCSFLFARTSLELTDEVLRTANAYARRRGPDATNVVRRVDQSGQHLTFLHNLLDISGKRCVQPLIQSGPGGGETFVLFNGEIYNFQQLGAFANDSECLLPTFRRFGTADLPAQLDGEFAIVIYDAEAGNLSVFSDPFLTKPIYLGSNDTPGDYGVATCASTLQCIGLDHVEMVEPNAAYRIGFAKDQGTCVEKRSSVTPFSIDQHKQTYEDWTVAFRDAVRKRACHGAHKPVVFLSSGYDSGAICLALNLQGIPYDTISIEAGENSAILKERIRINQRASCQRVFQVKGLRSAEIKAMRDDIQQHVEPFTYVHEDAPGKVTSLQADGGAMGGNYLAAIARQQGQLANLSGSGADEILSDYGYNGKKFYHHSQFGGLFPERLDAFFPWKKFYGDTQRSYLFKEEFILGRHGVEGRYPFLDHRVVQEFLWLDAKLKNRAYKAPLAHFLGAHQYPFEPMRKRGFSPHADLSLSARLVSKARRGIRKMLSGTQ
jgi:asparagine synthetase B (glutamine-hydrolysing)